MLPQTKLAKVLKFSYFTGEIENHHFNISVALKCQFLVRKIYINTLVFTATRLIDVDLGHTNIAKLDFI